MQRAIHVFPAFQNCEAIEEVRKKYDPLYGLIPPHLTLVFPFESEMPSTTLKRHVKDALTGLSPFTIRLKGITGTQDNYLFLNVKKGNDQIIELHDRLYAGVLRNYLSLRHVYIPHITVGRLHDDTELQAALIDTRSMETSFETQVNQVAAEIIESSGASIIEFIVDFA
ncbi:2'-5' RNA ligase family protein [Paenibacillus spongiae]|uniref:2'-5' RNA ligase family protein n=1 Tax=Paenibacillus spongiae TaxID=2909671 RepID=A0ABY5S171_9BACL|nr:2'-5' RNA ligase family protein [Paenibacillus spongiae]UVI27606.1 2'-5' RNA ligase family protein [Paenibacillus spongiae]